MFELLKLRSVRPIIVTPVQQRPAILCLGNLLDSETWRRCLPASFRPGDYVSGLRQSYAPAIAEFLCHGKFQPFRSIATPLTCRRDRDVEPPSRRVSPRRRSHKPSAPNASHLAHLPRLMALASEFDWRSQAAEQPPRLSRDGGRRQPNSCAYFVDDWSAAESTCINTIASVRPV
jgi:hypothetical protein